MSLTVGDVTAIIRADASQFDSTVDGAGKKFSGLHSMVVTGAKTIATSFTVLTTGAAVMGAAVFKVGADYNRLQQSSRAALSTLLGSAEAANAQMDKLDAFAKNSPFAKQVFISAQQQLLGFGVQAEKVLPILDAVQNAVAAVGGSNDQVSQVTYALAQMQGQGKLTGETLNQLGQYGIDAAGIVGAEMGKTGAEIRDMASKPGGISVDKVWDPLVNGLMERFGGATANIKLQYDGAVDRIKGATRDIGSTLAAPFIDPKGGGMAVEWANKVADVLRALETKAKPLVDILVVRLGPAFARITPGLEAAKSAINGWDLSKVNGQIDTLVKYAPLVAGAGAALFAFGTTNIPILSTLGLTINPVVAGIAALVATSPELRAVGRDFLAGLQPVLPILAELGVTTANVAMEVLRSLAPALGDLSDASTSVIVALASGLSPALLATLEALVPVAEVAGDVMSAVASLPTPVLAAVAAFVAMRQVDLSPVLAGARAAFGSFSETVQASRGVLEATGRSAGVMNTAMMTARVGVTGLGTALTTAFLSNPVGIAIAAISLALGAYATKVAEAKARTETYAESVKLLGEEADIAASKIAAENFVNNDDWGWWQKLNTGFDSAADAMDHLGLSIAEAASAVAMSQPEYDTYIASLEKMKAQYPEHETALNEIIIKIGQQRTGLEGAADRQDQMNRYTSEAKGPLDEQRSALELLNGEIQANSELNLSQAEATLRAEDSQVRTTDAINKAKAAQEEANRVNGDAAASEEEKAAATKAAEDATRSASMSILSNVDTHNSQIATMQKNNATNRDLIVAVMAARQSFIDQQVSMGKTREEANKLADQYGLIPSSVITNVSANMGDAEGKIQAFVQTWNGHRVNIYFDAKSGGPINSLNPIPESILTGACP